MEVLYTLAIPAIVKLVQEINLKDWKSVGLIILAAASGAGLGFVTGGLTGIVTGIAQGLSAAGIVTVANKVSTTTK